MTNLGLWWNSRYVEVEPMELAIGGALAILVGAAVLGTVCYHQGPAKPDRQTDRRRTGHRHTLDCGMAVRRSASAGGAPAGIANLESDLRQQRDQGFRVLRREPISPDRRHSISCRVGDGVRRGGQGDQARAGSPLSGRGDRPVATPTRIIGRAHQSGDIRTNRPAPRATFHR